MQDTGGFNVGCGVSQRDPHARTASTSSTAKGEKEYGWDCPSKAKKRPHALGMEPTEPVSSSVTRKMNGGMKASSKRSQALRSNQTIFDIIEEMDGCGNIAYHPGSSSGYSDGWEEVLLQTGGLQETRNHSDERWIRIDKAMTEDEVAKIERNKKTNQLENCRTGRTNRETGRIRKTQTTRTGGQEDKEQTGHQDDGCRYELR